MLLCVCMMLGLVGCGGGDTASNKVVIYSSSEEFRNEYYLPGSKSSSLIMTSRFSILQRQLRLQAKKAKARKQKRIS